jgi:hypothetical protein
MRAKVFLLASLSSWTLGVGSLSAANLDLPRAEIRINLHNKNYILKSWGRSYKEFPSQTLEDSMSFSIVPGEKVYIFIDDPNPFSNSYSWLVGNNSTTTNVEAAQGFADKLLGIVKGLDPAPGGSARLVPPPLDLRRRLRGGVALVAYRQEPLPTDSIVQPPASQQLPVYQPNSAEILMGAGLELKSLGAADSETRAQNIIDDAVKRVRARPAPSAGKKVKKILATAGITDPEDFLKKFKAAVGELYLLSEQADGLLQDVNEGRGDAAKAVVNSWELLGVEDELTSDYGLMHKAGEALQAKLSVQGTIRESMLSQGIDFEANPPDSKETVDKFDNEQAGSKLALDELELESVILDACIMERRNEPNLDLSDGDCITLFKGSVLKSQSRAGDDECNGELKIWRKCESVKLANNKLTTKEQVCNSPNKRLGSFKFTCTSYSAVELQRRIRRVNAKLKWARADVKEFASLEDAASALRDVERELPRDPFFLSLIFILPRETETRDALAELQRFERTMKKVNVPIKVGTIDFADPGSIRNAKLRVETVSEESTTPLVKTDLAPGTKEYNFAFRPYSAFQLGVGGATVFSFVKGHKFEALPVTGGFRITDSQKSDYSSASVAAMLTFVPSAWAQSDFHPLFEIGAGPQSSLALYAGAGVQFGKVFSFGAGVVFEQLDQLASGLSVGQMLANASDLKTKKSFVGGLYLHLTATANVSGGKSN